MGLIKRKIKSTNRGWFDAVVLETSKASARESCSNNFPEFGRPIIIFV